MSFLKKLLFLLNANERKQAALLLLMILVMALLDMIGVASILPFMTVLTNPTLIETNIFLNSLYEASIKLFGTQNIQEFIFVLGVMVFVLLIISLSFKALTTYIQLRYILMREYSIGKRLIEGYLHQPYSWFLNRHSAELGKTILSEVQQIVGYGMKPMMVLITQGMIAIALISLLFVADPKLSLIVGSSLISIYGLIFYFIRNYLNLIGKERLKNNNLRFKSISEAFNATKEIKVGGLEQTYINNFSTSAKIFARTQASSQVISQLPRFILEAIAFGGIIIIILYIMAQKGSFTHAIPIVSLYVFAGYRLMPALQQIYGSFTSLTFVGPSLDRLCKDLKNLKTYEKIKFQDILTINKSISLNNVSYNYPNSSLTALKNISLNIPAKSKVGLVGATGSGKTTTVDIILGLLNSQIGTLEIDGQIINSENTKAWQKSIGYVPQNIYLSDDTVAANIAFGLDPKDIDLALVKDASTIANLHHFVNEDLPQKYETLIGERGVRLSGGQRQRIGIARALYHKPQLLVFDEATSALDNETEDAVMKAVNNLNKDMTIIMIAHRLNTVKDCDIIYKFEKGQIVGIGKFNELFKTKMN
tara:strand:+ start:1028 stop:2800 length:1773 start_codon:yes stop_codon:yes gene_type:complete